MLNYELFRNFVAAKMIIEQNALRCKVTTFLDEQQQNTQKGDQYCHTICVGWRHSVVDVSRHGFSCDGGHAPA